jgi:hypothetical protein
MPKFRAMLPTRWWSRLLWVFGSYIFAADILPNLLLLIINCSGYLPYSDRPGPGWQAPHLPGKEEIGFFFGFALYMGIPSLLYAAGQVLLAFAFGFCSLPKWLVRLLGAITGFIAAGLLMAGAGWMIAISSLGIYLAACCGLLWGLFVMPSFVVPRGEHLPMAVRIGIPLLLELAAVFYLLSPLIPRRPIAPITFEMNRVTSGTELVRADKTPYLKAETQAEIDALGLHGDIHGGVQSSQGTNNEDVDVVVLTLRPIDHEYKLDIPEHGHVVYILADGKLTPHPPFQGKDKRHIWIEPGENSTYDGGKIRVGNDGKFIAFTWYPTIRR